MISLLETAANVGAGAFAKAARRTIASAMGLLLSTCFFLVSLAFFTLAAYRALAVTIGDIHTPLIIGGSYLVVALVALVIVQSRR